MRSDETMKKVPHFPPQVTSEQAEGTLLASMWSKRGRARPLLYTIPRSITQQSDSKTMAN
jgi:hypothetical protein